MAQQAVKRGNTSPLWRIGVPSYDANGQLTGGYEDLSVNYSCTVAVPSAVPAISRAVTALSSDNERYLVQLTPDETDTLADGIHTVAIEVSNATTTPPFKVEIHLNLVVEEDLI